MGADFAIYEFPCVDLRHFDIEHFWLNTKQRKAV